MKERTIEIYNDSFERCIANPEFFIRFYELFLDSSPQVKDLFKNTDLKKQARIVKKTLYSLTMASVGTEELLQEINRIGHSHGRDGLCISPQLYDLWLTCLLQTVKEFDRNWTLEVEISWRNMLESHIETLKRYSL